MEGIFITMSKCESNGDVLYVTGNKSGSEAVMEELLAYTILRSEELISEDEYNKWLDKLFLSHPENEELLCSEWETYIKKAMVYVKTHIDYNNFDLDRFGKILLSRLEAIYINCTDIKWFADRMYALWESLPENVWHIEPFQTLCCADDPLSWGEEEETRKIYECILNYYKN